MDFVKELLWSMIIDCFTAGRCVSFSGSTTLIMVSPEKRECSPRLGGCYGQHLPQEAGTAKMNWCDWCGLKEAQHQCNVCGCSLCDSCVYSTDGVLICLSCAGNRLWGWSPKNHVSSSDASTRPLRFE